jgi:diacylglycerol kinase (ATP)
MICFILNPNSGNKSNRYRMGILEKLQKIPNSELHITQYPGHAKEIVHNLINEHNATRIVAIGGDGTVNEIGACIQGTNIALGIIPIGSGNGLARHLGISMQFNKALKQALQGKEHLIDTLSWNDKPFFCTAGIGFDAEVASKFARGNGRGLFNYIKATLQTLKTYQSTKLNLADGELEDLYSLTIANANQYGNNAYISPFSNLQDAQFEVVKIKKGNIWQIGQLGISLFFKTINKQQIVHIFSTDSFEMRVAIGTKFHLDGESLRTDEEIIKIKIFAKNLKIVI